MKAPASHACDADDDGCQTFFYTNQQSARLMFYHDHAWGITRLNVYAGEAAGYLITDDTEKKLITDGVIPGAADTLPLIVQDKTFVPSDDQLKDRRRQRQPRYGQDPTWDTPRWGGTGSLWYHHVYMPAQNPGDASRHECLRSLDVRAVVLAAGHRHQVRADPQPVLRRRPASSTSRRPGSTRPTRSASPSRSPARRTSQPAWSSSTTRPLVNGVAYPKVTLDPKPYRLRMLNAANDRFFNFQWYIADPSTGTAARSS